MTNLYKIESFFTAAVNSATMEKVFNKWLIDGSFYENLYAIISERIVEGICAYPGCKSKSLKKNGFLMNEKPRCCSKQHEIILTYLIKKQHDKIIIPEKKYEIDLLINDLKHLKLNNDSFSTLFSNMKL